MKTHYAFKEQKAGLIKCKIKLTTRSGETYIYYGLFKSTSEAVIDALNRFDTATIFAAAA